MVGDVKYKDKSPIEKSHNTPFSVKSCTAFSIEMLLYNKFSFSAMSMHSQQVHFNKHIIKKFSCFTL